MDPSTSARAQRIYSALSGRQRQRASQQAGGQGGVALVVGVTATRAQPSLLSQRSRLPSTVERAPQLWSALYDGLSASDRRWVLDTIARYRRA
jgi:hypothetical protein